MQMQVLALNSRQTSSCTDNKFKHPDEINKVKKIDGKFKMIADQIKTEMNDRKMLHTVAGWGENWLNDFIDILHVTQVSIELLLI